MTMQLWEEVDPKEDRFDDLIGPIRSYITKMVECHAEGDDDSVYVWIIWTDETGDDWQTVGDFLSKDWINMTDGLWTRTEEVV